MDFLTKQVFSDHYKNLVEVFPVLKSPQRTQRIAFYMKDLPAKAIEEIFNNFLDTCKAAPTPIDFKTAASEWRRRNVVFVDPYFEIRNQIDAMTRMKHNELCFKCNNTGEVTGCKKYSALSFVTYTCDCKAGELLRKIPNQPRCYDMHDPFYVIFDFDPKKKLKYSFYSHISLNLKDAIPFLNELYYAVDIYLEPVYWNGYNIKPDPDKNPFKNFNYKNELEVNKLRNEVMGYLKTFNREFEKNLELDYI